MNVNRTLQIHDGDALKTFQGFLAAWWEEIKSAAMLVPVELPDHTGSSPQPITKPADQSWINPFAPIILNNSASIVNDFVRDHPQSCLAVILCTCELRVLVEFRKRNRVQYHRFSTDNGGESLIIIGVDCPEIFSLGEYAEHVASHKNDASMLRVGLTHSWRNRYIPRLRVAFPVCVAPNPLNADITIGTIGVAPLENLLVIAGNENDVMIRKLINKGTEKRSVFTKVQAWRAKNINTTGATFAHCTLCTDCLDACPLSDGELRGLLGVGEAYQSSLPLLSELVNLIRWLASCSGCGMCQEASEHGIPRIPLITLLRCQIQANLNYKNLVIQLSICHGPWKKSNVPIR